MALVSIIVPVYNTEKYIKECVDTIINQSLRDIEIILVDDGSTDGCPQICDEYALLDSRIRVIHKENQGLGMARNSGLELATGEYVGFVDSDDFVSAIMYETLLENAREYDADVSYCMFERFYDKNSIDDVLGRKTRTRLWRDEEIAQYMCDRIGLPPRRNQDTSFSATVCAGIFRKSIIDEHQIRFCSERQFISEDMLFDIDYITKIKCVVHCDSVLYFYRYNPDSLTGSYKSDRYTMNKALVQEMKGKLTAIYPLDMIRLPLYRYYITHARYSIYQEYVHIKTNGLKRAIRNIRGICSDDAMRDFLCNYPYKEMSRKHRFFCMLVKRNMAMGIIVMYCLKHLFTCR